MNLSEIPVKLPDDIAEQWKNEILEMAGNKTLGELVELMEAIPDIKSIRSPLSNFLNGYGHEIHKWLEPNKNGKALCEVLGIEIEDLRARYLAILPTLHKPLQLNSSLFNLLPLRVQWRGAKQAQKQFRSWFEENAPQILQKEYDKNEGIQWEQLKESLLELHKNATHASAPHTIALQITSPSMGFFRAQSPEDLTGHLGKARVQAFIERPESSNEFVAYDSNQHPQNETVQTFTISFLPLRLEEFRSWLTDIEKRGYLTRDESEQIHAAFTNTSEKVLNDFAPEHLMYALEELRTRTFNQLDELNLSRQRVEWLRRDLHGSATPEGQNWAIKTLPFFIRWIEKTGTLAGDVSTDELNAILEMKVTRPSEVDSPALVERLLAICLHNHDLAELQKSVREVYSHRLIELQTTLLDSGFVIKANNRWQLTTAFQRLGEAELALNLKPDALHTLDINASHQLLIQACKLAEPTELNAWCEAALASKGIDQPLAMLAVLEGISQRHDQAVHLPQKMLRTLWASTLWASLFGLNFTLHGSSFSHMGSTALRASEVFKDRLPLLNTQQSFLESLRELVDPRIIELVNQWRAPDQQTEEALDRPLQYFTPFQVPLTDIKVLFSKPDLPPDLTIEPSERAIHLAHKGDPIAKCGVLFMASNEQTEWETLPPEEILALWRSVADEKPLTPDEASSFQWQFNKFFKVLTSSPSAELVREFRLVLDHRELRSRLPGDVAHPLEAMSEGPAQAVEWLLKEYHSNNQLQECSPPDDIFFNLCQILERKDILLHLINLDIVNLPNDLQDDLLLGSYTSPSTQFGSPFLSFPRLKWLARIRHRAIILLAELGDAEPLRNTRNTAWEVRHPSIATERALWQALMNATDIHGRHASNLPEIDDDSWKSLIEELTWTTLEQTVTNWVLTRPNLNADIHTCCRHVDNLAAFSAPPDQRWKTLSLHARTLWNRRLQHDSPFKKLILPLAQTDKDNDTWREPQKLIDERRQWALRNDPETIRDWCQNKFNIVDLSKDLDGFGERAWPFLDSSQKEALLCDLPATLSEMGTFQKWWSRAQELPLTKRLEFARKHSTLKQRCEIAKLLINSASAPIDRLEYWLDLQPEERPKKSFMDRDIDSFINSVKNIELENRDLSIAYALLKKAPSHQVVKQLLAPVLKSLILYYAQPRRSAPPLSFKQETEWLFQLIAPVLGSDEFTRADRESLHDQLKAMENNLIVAINKNECLKKDMPELLESIKEQIKSILKLVDEIWSKKSHFPQTLKEAQTAFANSLSGSESLSSIGYIIYDLPQNDRSKFLDSLLTNPALPQSPQLLAEFFWLFDESGLSYDRLFQHLNDILENASAAINKATDIAIADENRQSLIIGMLSAASTVRNTQLRKELRRFVEDLSRHSNA